MRLDHLADVELRYVGPFAFVVPFEREGGSYFSNRAHKRADGRAYVCVNEAER